MKKILFILLIGLVSNVSFAQLTVKGSSYIYADDVVVFVEDDVKLAAADDFFYLRNGAQLIQGTGVTGNTGVGKLSVYQTGTVNNFDYNYWGSPVGNIDADDATNRAFRANSILYDVDTAPITSSIATYYTGSSYDGTSSPLVIADYWIWAYNPGINYNEWDHIRSTGNLATGYGFTMKGTSGSGSSQLYDFRGKPNSGNISVSVEKDQFTLVGNPYPSALDALDFTNDAANTDFDGTLYYWEQKPQGTHYIADYQGGYATYTITLGGVETFLAATFDTYNGDGSINTAGGGGPNSSGKKAWRYIPVGQGFMIQGVSSLVGTGTVNFKNSYRNFAKEGGTTSEFFRVDTGNKKNNDASASRGNDNETTYESAEVFNEIQYTEDGLSIVPEGYRRFRVNVDFNDLYTRQLVQTFHSTATDGFDRGLESRSPSSLTTDANWVLDDVAYVSQAFQLNTELKIPLVVKIATPQTVRFRAFDIQNFDDIAAIYLHDIDTDFYYDLKTQNYEVFLDEGNYTTRFEITFEQGAALGLDDNFASQLQLFQNNEQSEITVLNPNSLEVKDFKLYDINGRLILSKNKLESKNKHTFNTSNLSSGIYIVNIKLAESDVLVSKKVLIDNN